MRIKIVITLIFILATLNSGCSLLGIPSTEEASYELIRKQDSFEIRQYPTLVLAQTSSKGQWREAQNKSFSRLFAYITGANKSKQDITMTAPVYVKQKQSEEIPMTAPVYMAENDYGAVMSFVLPNKYTMESAPTPNDNRVTIVELPGHKRLVHTFSGLLNVENISEATQELLNYANSQGIHIIPSTLNIAGYNPPWTIPALRRNEVIVDIK